MENNVNFMVVNKPPSIPIHPCSLYNYNSLLFILAKEHNFNDLYPVHRLDRLTSGLVIFGKTSDFARKFSGYLKERKIKKSYIALVKGNFPSKKEEINENIHTTYLKSDNLLQVSIPTKKSAVYNYLYETNVSGKVLLQ